MLHKDAVLGDSHFPHTWLYANAAARTGATGFLSTDVYKLALQVDTQALYILTATTPAWYAVGITGGAVSESHTAAVWTAANTVMVEGAFGYETDTTKFKIGDGATAWNSLSYWRYVPVHSTVATTGGTTVLTTEQSKATSLQTTGVLVSNATIVVANTMAPFVAENTNTGAFTTTFKTSAGTGIAIAQATHQMLYADGVNVETASSAGAGSGDVVGPASAVNLGIAQYSGTTGKIISDSGVAVSALEVVANKATSFATVNNTLYPSVQAVKNYVDPLVVGLWDDRGSYNASVNTFPAAGGSGTAGAILKGDIWTISVAGTLGGAVVKIGDTVRALADAPGQTASNWSILETNIGYVPANVAGNLGQFAATTSLQLANTISDETGSGALVFANTPTLVTPVLGAATATSINGCTLTSGTLNGSVTGSNTGDNATNTQYSGLVTNATHTGDATGSAALTVVAINGTAMSGLATGILKNTTTTGVPSIAVAGDFPTLNQSTTGNATTATTTTNLAGGSGGTIPYQSAAGTTAMLANGTAGQVLQSNGTTTAPSWVAAGGGGNAQTANPLSQFAATTSAQLAGVISDETGSGALVFANTPTLVTPVLGAATATSINGATITSGTLNGSVTGSNTGDNTVATGLLSATTTVSVSAAAAPTNGQVLTATAGTTATWQTPAVGGDVTLAGAQTFITNIKKFTNSLLALLGSSTGWTIFTSANASATNYTITVPAADVTMAGLEKAQTFTKTQSATVTSLTSSGASIAVDLTLSNNFSHTMTENTTLAAPSGGVAGTSGQIVFTQHASAAKTLAFNAAWVAVTGTAGVISTTVGAVNVLSYYVVDSTHVWYSWNKAGVA